VRAGVVTSVLASSLVTALGLPGCSNDKAPDGPKMLGSLAGQHPPSPPTALDGAGGEGSEATERVGGNETTHHDPIEHQVAAFADGGPSFAYTVNIRKEGGTAPDPDAVTIETGRKAAGACFTGITDGSRARSATIRLFVLPSGTVNRSEVSAPGTTEPWVLSCLDGVGGGLHFSDKPKADIRNFIVSAMVTLGH